MTSAEQEAIDARVLDYYTDGFDEDARLTTRSPQGPLEFYRTQELIAAHLPPGRVLDIGGGTGRHARALVDHGYDVKLLDPVPRHVEAALARGVSAVVGDARALPFEDGTFDAALLLGPLYHLASRHDRRAALLEAKRVTTPGGAVIAVGLSRLVGFAALSLGRATADPMPTPWIELLESGRAPEGGRFPAGHFHTAEELAEELASAGLAVVDVVGVEGPAGALLETVDEADPETIDAALRLARFHDNTPGIRDFSAHLLVIARV